jgi:serine/threonine-protein kinase
MMHVEAPPPIDDPTLALPPALLPVLRSALAKDPGGRFPDAASMAAALRAARGGTVAGLDSSRTEVVHTRRLPVVGRRHRAPLAVALGAVLAAAVTTVVLMRGTAENPPGPAVSPSAAVPSVPALTASESPLPYTLATEAPVETPPPRVPAVLPTPAGAPSPVTVPSPIATAVPTPAPSMPAASPSLAPPSPRESPGVPVVPAPAAPTPMAPVQGWLRVLPKQWADVTVDGRVVGQTPLAPIALAPGSHSVVLTHPDYPRVIRKVEIRAGETTTIRLDLATEGKRR